VAEESHCRTIATVVRDNTARTKNAVESFHATLRRRVKVAHPNIYTFLGHLQRATTDSEAEMARTNHRLSIPVIKEESVRRKGRTNHDLHFPVRQWCLPFLNAVSHSVGAHSNALCEVDNQSDSDDETDGDAAAAEPQEQQTQAPPAMHQARSLTTMQSCARLREAVRSPETIGVWPCSLRPLRILRIVRKRGSPHSTWMSTSYTDVNGFAFLFYKLCRHSGRLTKF